MKVLLLLATLSVVAADYVSESNQKSATATYDKSSVPPHPTNYYPPPRNPGTGGGDRELGKKKRARKKKKKKRKRKRKRRRKKKAAKNQTPGTGRSVEETLALADVRIRQNIAPPNRGLAATYLRLGFHDCVPNDGGCDGCLNLETNPANNGLRVAVDSLAPIVADLEDERVSRADLWAYAVLVAAEVSQDTHIFTDDFEVGRLNCETAGTCSGNNCATFGPDEEADHPSAHLTTHELLDFMDAHFGFGARETVAIMGVHTLGEALPENSGFEGELGWVENNEVLGKFLRLSKRLCGSISNLLVRYINRQRVLQAVGWS